MPWAKLDDTFHAHPKVRQAGLAAIGLHARAISFSAAYLRNGKVDSGWVEETAGKKGLKLADELVNAGLWEPNGTGWYIHDYLEYNPSREKVLARRAADAARKGNTP